MKSFAKTKGSLNPNAWEPAHQPMNDGAQIAMHILFLQQALETGQFDGKLFSNVLGRNQNPHCGGDGTLSGEQWKAARQVEIAIRKLEKAIATYMTAPTKPLVCEGPPPKPLDSVFGDDDIPF